MKWTFGGTTTTDDDGDNNNSDVDDDDEEQNILEDVDDAVLHIPHRHTHSLIHSPTSHTLTHASAPIQSYDYLVRAVRT